MNRLAAFSFAAIVSIAGVYAEAKVELHPLFADQMVLQRDVACPIWGTVDANAKVEVTLDGKPVGEATADDTGAFRIRLPRLEAGFTPHTLVVTSNGESKTIRDVLVGDVWLCSGQSNMQWTVGDSQDQDAEIAAANHPNLRLFHVTRTASAEPVGTVKGTWQATSPETIGGFSAVAYFFGRKLQAELDIPIGLIHSSWGGTPAESWTPLPVLRKLDLAEVGRQVARRERAAVPGARERFEREWPEWLKATGRLDGGIDPAVSTWKEVELDTTHWREIDVPGDWTQQGFPNGCVWFRRTIDVPQELAGKPLTLRLGAIDDYDVTFFNSHQVGSIGQARGDMSRTSRSYVVPGELVKAGTNVIAIRVFDTGGSAGFQGLADKMTATVGGVPIPLAGRWLARMESVLRLADGPQPEPPQPPMQLDGPHTPAGLYNGMIHPLADFGIKGAIWYQGESNTGRFWEYEKLMTALIGAWRDQFGVGDFPFYVVGLANFMAPTDDPNKPTNWAGLREAQRMLDRNVKNVATTVTIDIGEENDIHPRNKQDVGLRLALVALEETYGQRLVSRGPTFDRADFEEGKVVVRFENVGGGLKAQDGMLGSFAIAGEDGVFRWADARIEGNTVVLTAAGVDKPVHVRYAWADNPKASLFNAEGLPAEPFEAKK